MQRSAAVAIGMSTPEMFSATEKRSQFSKKKISDAHKSSDSSSSEGDLSSDTAQNMDKKTSKSLGLKLYTPTLSGSFLHKTTSEEKNSNITVSQGSYKSAKDRLSPSSSTEGNRRPSWERPWRNSWDATLTSALSDIQYASQDRLMHHSCDIKWKSKSYKALPASYGTKTKENNTDNSVKVVHQLLHPHKSQVETNSENQQNSRQSTGSEISPAALAEIAVSVNIVLYTFNKSQNIP